VAAVLHGTLFLGRTAALTGSIFELAELHDSIHNVDLARTQTKSAPCYIRCLVLFRATSTEYNCV